MERIIDILSEYADEQYNWDERICAEIERTCLRNKQNLIDMLSNHPQWDADNYRIHFNADFSRAQDVDAAESYLHKLLCGIEGCANSDKAYALRKVVQSLRAYRYLFVSSTGVIENDYMYKDLLHDHPDMRLHEGAKCTKSLLKILRQYGFEEPELFPDSEKLTELRRLYAQYADAMTPLTIKRHTVLSVNPCDFLLMSNGVSWQSCHDIRHGGCYQAGCWSYAYDSQTMMLYIIDEDVEDEGITEAGKIYRQLYHWNGSLLYGARLYPQSCDDGNASAEYKTCREIVEQVIATCLGEPNLWKHADYWEFYSSGEHYRDYDCEYCDNLKAYHLSSKVVESKYFHVGSDEPICPVCGENLSAVGEDYSPNEQIVCLECADVIRRKSCGRCGEVYRESELSTAYYDNGDEYVDEYVCQDCIDDGYYIWSNAMHTYLRSGDAESFVNCYGNDDYATEVWLEDHGYYKCYECGSWEKGGETTEEGHFYCNACLDDNAYQCDECGQWHDCGPNILGDEALCDKCYAERLAERENEETDEPSVRNALAPNLGIVWNGEKFEREVC